MELTHVDIGQNTELSEVKSGEWLTYFVGDSYFPYPHLHLGMKYNNIYRNPLDWLSGSSVGYYFDVYRTLPRGI